MESVPTLIGARVKYYSLSEDLDHATFAQNISVQCKEAWCPSSRNLDGIGSQWWAITPIWAVPHTTRASRTKKFADELPLATLPSQPTERSFSRIQLSPLPGEHSYSSPLYSARSLLAWSLGLWLRWSNKDTSKQHWCAFIADWQRFHRQCRHQMMKFWLRFIWSTLFIFHVLLDFDIWVSSISARQWPHGRYFVLMKTGYSLFDKIYSGFGTWFQVHANSETQISTLLNGNTCSATTGVIGRSYCEEESNCAFSNNRTPFCYANYTTMCLPGLRRRVPSLPRPSDRTWMSTSNSITMDAWCAANVAAQKQERAPTCSVSMELLRRRENGLQAQLVKPVLKSTTRLTNYRRIYEQRPNAAQFLLADRAISILRLAMDRC